LLFPDRDGEAWESMPIDDELAQWVKCGTCCMVDEQLHFPPDPQLAGQPIGWLVGIGDTIEEAIKHLRHNTELLPDGAHCEFAALADLLKEVKEAEANDMPFTDQTVPEPETILKDT
jgi:hypothetical protein